MSDLQVFLQEFLATPLASFICSILGAIIVILTCLGKLKKAIYTLKLSKDNYDNSNTKLSNQINELKEAREELKKTREENLELKNDIKLLKQAAKVVVRFIPEAVSSGAAREVIKLLEEKDGESNEEKQV